MLILLGGPAKSSRRKITISPACLKSHSTVELPKIDVEATKNEKEIFEETQSDSVIRAKKISLNEYKQRPNPPGTCRTEAVTSCGHDKQQNESYDESSPQTVCTGNSIRLQEVNESISPIEMVIDPDFGAKWNQKEVPKMPVESLLPCSVSDIFEYSSEEETVPQIIIISSDDDL